MWGLVEQIKLLRKDQHQLRAALTKIAQMRGNGMGITPHAMLAMSALKESEKYDDQLNS